MERRRFLTLVGGAAAAWPLGAHAQEAGRMYRLGVLVPTPRESSNPAAFFDELRGLGFVEGQNLKIVAGSFRLETMGFPRQSLR